MENRIKWNEMENQPTQSHFVIAHRPLIFDIRDDDIRMLLFHQALMPFRTHKHTHTHYYAYTDIVVFLLIFCWWWLSSLLSLSFILRASHSQRIRTSSIFLHLYVLELNSSNYQPPIRVVMAIIIMKYVLHRERERKTFDVYVNEIMEWRRKKLRTRTCPLQTLRYFFLIIRFIVVGVGCLVHAQRVYVSVRRWIISSIRAIVCHHSFIDIRVYKMCVFFIERGREN